VLRQSSIKYLADTNIVYLFYIPEEPTRVLAINNKKTLTKPQRTLNMSNVRHFRFCLVKWGGVSPHISRHNPPPTHFVNTETPQREGKDISSAIFNRRNTFKCHQYKVNLVQSESPLFYVFDHKQRDIIPVNDT